LSIPLPIRDPTTLLQLHSIWCLKVKMPVSLQFVCAPLICGHCRDKLKNVLATTSVTLMFICYRYRRIVAKFVLCICMVDMVFSFYIIKCTPHQNMSNKNSGWACA
jgi:hypothetical protein